MINMDCPFCLIHCCKKCIVTNEENKFFYKLNKTEGEICLKCYNIKKKIYSHQSYDKKFFNQIGDIDIESILNILNEQDYKCYLCNDDLITMFYKPYCCYQFSIDRIDNIKPHNKNNIRISCYYCNCKHHNEFNQQNKICNSGCHEKKVKSKLVKTFIFNNFKKPTLIEYDINKPYGKIYKSKIAYMCGIPLMIDWLNDKKSDNQFATFLVADPLTGFAPFEFQKKAGTIILFREDEIELTIDDIDYIWEFFSMLMNYTIYQDNRSNTIVFNNWEEMIKHPCMNKKSWDNCVRSVNESKYKKIL